MPLSGARFSLTQNTSILKKAGTIGKKKTSNMKLLPEPEAMNPKPETDEEF